MIERIDFTKVKQLLSRSPAVVLLGPRQCGKTTLSKRLSKLYFDLENTEDQTALDVRWNELIQPIQKHRTTNWGQPFYFYLSLSKYHKINRHFNYKY
ncbi:MAG: AAA family ATPase [Elusimicrobiota bacterium]